MRTLKRFLFTSLLTLAIVIASLSVLGQIKYKLVRFDGQIVTGQVLYDQLIAEGFEIPFCPNQTVFQYPEPRPPYPYSGNKEAWDAWYAEVAVLRVEYNNLLAERKAIWNTVKELLNANFIIATYSKTGRTLPDGRPEIVWHIEASPTYTYGQFASILTGFNTNPWNRGDKVKWICFGFHSDKTIY